MKLVSFLLAGAGFGLIVPGDHVAKYWVALGFEIVALVLSTGADAKAFREEHKDELPD